MLKKECYNNQNIILKPEKIIFKNQRGEKEKLLNITVEDIRQQLNCIGYICPYKRETYKEYFSQAIERYSIPYMNYIYYLLFFELGRIPTFEEFSDKYIGTYCDRLENGLYRIKPFFDDNNNFSFTKEHVLGRVFRSYNSFHREIELLYQFKEYEGIEIEYNFQDDLNGIDFTIKYKGNIFYIASFVATSNSYAWKAIKNSNRHDYSEKNMIDVIARFKDEDPDRNCDSYNGIYTYSPCFVAQKYFEIVKRTEN